MRPGCAPGTNSTLWAEQYSHCVRLGLQNEEEEEEEDE